jgi:hypothetical protein
MTSATMDSRSTKSTRSTNEGRWGNVLAGGLLQFRRASVPSRVHSLVLMAQRIARSELPKPD